ncbi:MAG TPA: ABC transporter substrate-binding protein [Candidatus Limnocylindria bacterium]|nr:ABC transporter substrate-binding protein [Candidatus Limnocylindria bacterium]
MKVAVPVKVPTLDPHGAQSVEDVSHTVLQHVMESLVRREPTNGNIVAALATEWKNPDPTTWSFTLRDAKFHDGSKVTAADVKASLERVIALKGALAPQFAQVDTIAALDATTVQIKTKTAVGTLLANMAMVPIAPAAQLNSTGFFNKPVGSGPYKVVSWSADADLRLEANTDYWGSKPGVKTMLFRYYPEVAPLVTALQTGEIDFTWRLPPDQLPALQRDSNLKVDAVPGWTYYFIWMNSSRPVFADKRVRQAMVYALDVDKMIKDLLGSVAKRATAPIPSTVFGHAPQAAYAYDPAKAKQLLAQAGVPNGFDAGVIWNPGSAPQDRELLQTMISYWNAIGVRVKSQEMERAVWIDNLNKLNWDMDMQANAVTTGDGDFTLGRLYHSRANRNGYKNPDLDKILDDAVATVDQNRRKDLYAQANKIIWDDAVGIFPAELYNVFAYRKRVTGFTPTATAIMSFAGVTVQ